MERGLVMLKKSNKFIAYLVAFAIALSSLAGISFPIVRAIAADTILSAAAEYVMARLSQL